MGNWVQMPYGTPVRITLSDFARARKFDTHFGTYEPIPITEEWLDSIEDDGSFRLKYIKSIDAFEVEREYISFEKEEWIFISNCRYRHEWQNLHFALTGEELKEKK